MNTCPCCSDPLLRHVRHGKVYLFCRHCWQEMPESSGISSVSLNTIGTLACYFRGELSVINKNHTLVTS